jgi:hypothetical protein
MYAEHDRLLPLTEPSLHMNVSPWHRAMPPLPPLQGVLAARDVVDRPADNNRMSNAKSITLSPVWDKNTLMSPSLLIIVRS